MKFDLLTSYRSPTELKFKIRIFRLLNNLSDSFRAPAMAETRQQQTLICGLLHFPVVSQFTASATISFLTSWFTSDVE